MTHPARDTLRQLLAQPKGAERARACLHDFEAGAATGWFVAVPAAFRRALDLTSDGGTGYKQGSGFDFSEGMVLHAAPVGAGSDAPPLLTLQVRAARAAAPGGPQAPRDPGSVTVDLYTYGGGFRHRLQHTTTQDAFVAFLIDGPVEDGWEAVAAALAPAPADAPPDAAAPAADP